MYREPACTAGWVLRNTLILLDVHNEVEKCDKRRRQRERERGRESGIEPPKSAYPAATLEILRPWRGLTPQPLF